MISEIQGQQGDADGSSSETNFSGCQIFLCTSLFLNRSAGGRVSGGSLNSKFRGLF